MHTKMARYMQVKSRYMQKLKFRPGILTNIPLYAKISRYMQVKPRYMQKYQIIHVYLLSVWIARVTLHYLI